MRKLLSNTVLSTLILLLVLVMGLMSYNQMPRQQDPTINFNWIVIITALPGASAEDVEMRVTQPLEDSLRTLQDVNFVSSTSRVGLSNILVRFRDIDARTFDKRVNDLRREIQNKRDQLPSEVLDSSIIEITSANAFPSAMVVLQGQADDLILREQSYLLEREMERLKGIDRVDVVGLSDPELQVKVDFHALASQGITPPQLADAVAAQWQDVAIGKLEVADQQWLVRHLGQSIDPEVLAHLALPKGSATLPLNHVARVEQGQAELTQRVAFEGQPAVLFAVMKKDSANTIELVANLAEFIEGFNQRKAELGIKAILADDQTLPTKSAISLMESNALQGLVLVLLVSWLFLGWRVGILVAIAIPFSLAGVFTLLYATGNTLNLTVLLGVIIALGMLVDVAVVMVESMLHRLHQGDDTLTAAINAMQEIGWPIVAAVLTTIAAFLPLILLPGILGDFMSVVPTVVTIALLMSLVQAFWMLPSQTHLMHMNSHTSHQLTSVRSRVLKRLQNLYGRLLVKSFRHPVLTLLFLVAAFISVIMLFASGRITTNFFASDPLRVFYVNIEMPAGSTLVQTLEASKQVETQARDWLKPEEVRSMVTYSGQMFTEMEPLIGDVYGQVFISLSPPTEGMRSVDQIIDGLRAHLSAQAPPGAKVSLLKLSGGPPSSKPISVKVRGDDYAEIQLAIDRLSDILANMSGVKDISSDAALGSEQLITRLNMEAIERAGLHPNIVIRSLRLMADGEIVAQLANQGELIDLRVKGVNQKTHDIEAWLATPLATPSGETVNLGSLVTTEVQTGFVSLKHYNFARSITLEADLDKTQMDTLEANATLQAEWDKVAEHYPNISLDFSGELDDIEESLSSMGILFLLGIGLMYLILGAQFNSYLQPLIILFTVPMAFMGVAYGLWLSGNPLSLYTLYGVIALSGIAVNSAIVLIAATNERRQKGMSQLHAIVYAARRRLVPILITASTTMAGLMGLALGVGGHSLIFGPVATAIVWGILVSTFLTLFTIPLIYRLLVRVRS